MAAAPRVPSPSDSISPHAARNARFATTRWSIVLLAGRGQDRAAQDALAHLCEHYWYPIYAYVRRRGHAPADAQDLTQEFFARMLAQHTFAKADPERGRFRTFILTTLGHFLTDEWEKLRAQKRGGGQGVLSLDLAAAEKRFELEPADRDASPDRAFDRLWAMTLLDTVLRRLEAEYARESKAQQFATLRPALVGGSAAQPYAELAAALGTSEGAVKVTVHRLRKRYRELLQAEIADTVNTPEAARDELQELFRALGST